MRVTDRALVYTLVLVGAILSTPSSRASARTSSRTGPRRPSPSGQISSPASTRSSTTASPALDTDPPRPRETARDRPIHQTDARRPRRRAAPRGALRGAGGACSRSRRRGQWDAGPHLPAARAAGGPGGAPAGRAAPPAHPGGQRAGARHRRPAAAGRVAHLDQCHGKGDGPDHDQRRDKPHARPQIFPALAQ